MAILALVFGILVAPLGIVFGFVARSQIKKTGEDGDGLALAGIIIGGIFTLLFIAYIVFIIIFFAAVAELGPRRRLLDFAPFGSHPAGGVRRVQKGCEVAVGRGQKPSLPSCFGSRCQSLATLTRRTGALGYPRAARSGAAHGTDIAQPGPPCR